MPSKISLMTPVLQVDLDDTAALEVTNRLGQTRKSTIAQLRTAIVAGVLVAAHLTSPVIDSGGLTITSGTLGAQAVTATALTVTPGATSLAATSVTSLSGTGAVTGFTSYGGVVMSSGAVSGVTTLAGTGAISGFTTATFSGQIATGAPATLTEGQVVIRATVARPYQLQMENQDASRRWSFLIDTNSAADGNFGILDRTSGGVQFKIAPITGAWTFAAGGTITTGGLTVSAGTTAVQALTATTGAITANLTAFLLSVSNTNVSPFGVSIGYPSVAPNTTSNQFLTCGDSGTTRAEIRSNGGLANFSANNVNLSDARLKTDIRTLESVWDKHLGIRVVRAKYSDQTHGDDNYMGIAQNIGEVFPELMDDADPDRLGIYENDLNWITRGVVQECQRRIVALEGFRAQAVAKYPDLAA